MYFSDKIKLIPRAFEKDRTGNMIPVEGAPRTVYADILSIGRQEFYDAARAGMKPEIKAVVHAEDYRGEQVAEVSGRRYAVLRSYLTGSRTELYLEVKAGV